MKQLLIILSFLLLSSPLFGQSEETCYVAADSSKDFDRTLLSNISVSLISEFLKEVEPIPPAGISMNACVYQISAVKRKDTTFVTFTGKNLNSIGISKLSEPDGFQESLLKALYIALEDKRKLICDAYGEYIEKCGGVVKKIPAEKIETIREMKNKYDLFGKRIAVLDTRIERLNSGAVKVVTNPHSFGNPRADLQITSSLSMASAASSFECKKKKTSMAKPSGFPSRALTMIVPYGPAGGSGQIAAAMAGAVTGHTGVNINRDHKPGGSGTVGMTSYMSAPADGYTVLEHIDDASSAHALDSSRPNPAVDLIPLVISQVTFSQIYIRTNETRYNDWSSFVRWVKAQNGKSTIANVSKESSMERVTMKFITEAAGIKIQQISFDKGAPRYGALLGGQVDALFEQPGDVRKFLNAGSSMATGIFKPILTIFNERPSVFADVPTHKEMGMNFEPLLRFRGFYVHTDAPPDRVKWLQWAFQWGYCQDSYQKFNESKYMNVIDSFRDTAGARDLIKSSIIQYRNVYKEMGLNVK
jgi:tripartite-type tricarboxylate transporter receptor subunit TctC